MSTETNAPVTQFPTQPAAEAPVVILTLQDMASMVKVIDVCSRRGAFEGSELTSVGALREKLVQFINANTPQQPPAAAPAAEQAVQS